MAGSQSKSTFFLGTVHAACKPASAYVLAEASRDRPPSAASAKEGKGAVASPSASGDTAALGLPTAAVSPGSLAQFLDSGGTLGDSVVSPISNNIAIGPTNPGTNKLDVFGDTRVSNSGALRFSGAGAQVLRGEDSSSDFSFLIQDGVRRTNLLARGWNGTDSDNLFLSPGVAGATNPDP